MAILLSRGSNELLAKHLSIIVYGSLRGNATTYVERLKGKREKDIVLNIRNMR